MAQTNFTPILLYASSTPTNVPSAGNLTNSATGSEIAINIADKNLFFKDSGGAVNTVPVRQSSTSSNGWLSATDWNTFNNKAPATSGTSILYGNGSGGFSNVIIGTGITFTGGTLSATGTGGTVTSVTGTAPVVSSGGTTPAISMPAATTSVNGYLTSTDWNTFNSKQPAGTYVTSVGATSPVTSSGGTTPTIAMPAATTSVSGYLTSTDWNTFNNKGSGTVTSVTGTAPVVSSGGATPAISMAAATSSVNGYLTSTDWTTFNNKGSGTVTSVAALTLGTTGTDLSSTVANSTTTPVITLNVPTASAANRGALSAADWTTFNNKAPGVTFTTGYVPFGQGTTTLNQSANLFWDNTNIRLGINTSSPAQRLDVNGTANFGNINTGNGVSTGGASLELGGLRTGDGVSFIDFHSVSGTDYESRILRVGGANGALQILNNGTGDFRLQASGAAPMIFDTSATERMRIFASGGVSIGNTTDPGAGSLSVNGVIKIGSNQAVNGPAVSAYKSTNQSITTFTPTKITFDTESFDTNSNFASSTFTPTVAGYYQISAGFFPSADSTTFSRAFISIYKNGAEWQRLQDVTTIGSFITFLGASGSCLVYCNGSTDYIEAYGFIAGTNPVIGSGSTVTYFDAVMVRGA